MTNQKILENLSFTDLSSLDPEILMDGGTLDWLERRATDEQYDAEPGQAREFYEALDELVKKYDERLKSVPEAYHKLTSIHWQLFMKALPTFGVGMQQKILSQNVIFALKHKLAQKAYLQKTLGIYEFGLGPNQEERNRFAHSLEQNQEQLGDKPITLKVGGEVAQSIQNWLKDYNFSAANQARRGKLEEINYLNSSSNVRLLTTEEKAVLAQIISIYDWLKYPPSGPEVVGGPESESNRQAYIFAEKIKPPVPPPVVPEFVAPAPTVVPKPPVPPRPPAKAVYPSPPVVEPAGSLRGMASPYLAG